MIEIKIGYPYRVTSMDTDTVEEYVAVADVRGIACAGCVLRERSFCAQVECVGQNREDGEDIIFERSTL